MNVITLTLLFASLNPGFLLGAWGTAVSRDVFLVGRGLMGRPPHKVFKSVIVEPQYSEESTIAHVNLSFVTMSSDGEGSGSLINKEKR